jgi:phospholipid transport system substrate-binding protein
MPNRSLRSVLRSAFWGGCVAVALTLSSSSVSADDGAQAFIQAEQAKLSQLLRQPATAARDTQVTRELETMVDYDELARRAFGQPCPPSNPNCTNHWTRLTPQQQTEVRDLLKRLVEKNYKKNLLKTLDYDVTYKGTRDLSGDAKVRTEAKSKVKPRDPAVQVDYVVRKAGGNFRVVDIVTEGSSLTKNYYDQFHKMLTTAGQGYPHVVKKLNEKIAKKS